MFAHFVADFLCQNDQMGNNKGKSIKWLSIHVTVYTVVLGVLMYMFKSDMDIALLYWILLNGLIHWIVDFITSKISGYFYMKKQYRMFFHTIGFDQLLHGVSLFTTYYYFS